MPLPVISSFKSPLVVVEDDDAGLLNTSSDDSGDSEETDVEDDDEWDWLRIFICNAFNVVLEW